VPAQNGNCTKGKLGQERGVLSKTGVTLALSVAHFQAVTRPPERRERKRYKSRTKAGHDATRQRSLRPGRDKEGDDAEEEDATRGMKETQCKLGSSRNRDDARQITRCHRGKVDASRGSDRDAREVEWKWWLRSTRWGRGHSLVAHEWSRTIVRAFKQTERGQMIKGR
jgi:hypothetical protein